MTTLIVTGLLLMAAASIFNYRHGDNWLEDWQINRARAKQDARAKKNAEARENSNLALRNAHAKLWTDSPFQIPNPKQFGALIRAAYRGPMRPELVDHLVGVQSHFITDARFDKDTLTPEQAERVLDGLVGRCVRGLYGYAAKVDPRWKKTTEKTGPSPFTQQETNWGVELDEQLSDLARALIEPFKTDLWVLGIYFSDTFKRTAPCTDKRYSSVVEYAHMTPYYPVVEQLTPNIDTTKPFQIPEEARFFGQWIIGEPGAGKTTFISTMIAEDLKKVARNEASIFVMDSQNELVPDIARLEMFAPGRPLHDKLIYLEPNPDFPLALNIFDIDKKRVSSLSSSEERMMYEAGVEWMVDFFLKSLVKSDESSNQETFLAFVIPAVLAIPNATIFTMQDLLEPAKVKGGETGYDRYKQYFGKLREPTQRWLRDRLHSEKLAQTRNAVLSRLEGFSARGFFGDMFAHPKNKLDLFAELQNSKVILINTKGALLKKNLEPFGRYFIARLLQAAEERMFTERGNRLPVYAYIDEAHDYISNEENIEELKNKARKQKVALIIANQMESQIEMPLVRDALGKMAIQCRGEPPLRKGEEPIWYIQLGKQEPARISFLDTQFSKMPRMSEAQFREMLRDMQDRYCSPAHSEEFEETEPEQSHYQEPLKQRSDAPKDDEYDDRYDQLDKITLSPTKARMGTVITVNCPNGRSHQQAIPAGVHNGYRFCVKGASRIRRPDNRNGNYWVELEIAEMPGSRAGGDETDAKPW